MYTAVDIFIGLAHLSCRVLKTHNPCTVLWNETVRNLENIAVNTVKTLCNVSCNFNVLFLVCTDRHFVSLIEKNVGSHEYGICEKTGVDVVGMLCRLVLELRHS